VALPLGGLGDPAVDALQPEPGQGVPVRVQALEARQALQGDGGEVGVEEGVPPGGGQVAEVGEEEGLAPPRLRGRGEGLRPPQARLLGQGGQAPGDGVGPALARGALEEEVDPEAPGKPGGGVGGYSLPPQVLQEGLQGAGLGLVQVHGHPGDLAP
jgi:hypothetical protein